MLEVMVGWVVIILFGLIGIGVVTFIMIYSKSHRLRIRNPNERHSYVNDYWVMEKKDKKNGSVWWIAVNNKNIKIPEPPAECIDVGKKGRKFCEVYRLSENEYSYIKDDGLKEKDQIVKAFKPFSVVQRQTIVSQFIKAEEQKMKSFIKDNLVPATSIMGLVLIVIMLMVFWGDIAKPAIESHTLALRVQEQNIKIMQQIKSGGGDLAQIPEIETQGGINTPNERPPE